jgi:hypothetical protein
VSGNRLLLRSAPFEAVVASVGSVLLLLQQQQQPNNNNNNNSFPPRLSLPASNPS